MCFRFSIYLIITLSVLLSCSTQKEVVQKGNALKIKEANLQKIYPGVDGMKIRDDLYIKFEPYNTQEIIADSIYYNGKVYLLKTPNQHYGIDLTGGTTIKNSKHPTTALDSATIFYHKNTSMYYYTFGNIIRKQSVYAP